MSDYDLIVIGSGPAGEKAAVKAAYFGKRVAIIERQAAYGGAGVHTGTLPSKTLKETALYFSGRYENGLYGLDKKFAHQASIKDFLFRKNFVVSSENDEVLANIIRHKVAIYHGSASLLSPHEVLVTSEGAEQTIRGEYILIATGSRPVHPAGIPFDGVRIHDSDSILELTRFPAILAIVGAGVIGCEYATIFAAIGTKVFLINHTDKLLPFLDDQISGSLQEQMQAAGISILTNCTVHSVKPGATPGDMIETELSSGQHIFTDMFLYTAGRAPATDTLQCERAGVTLGNRGLIAVNHEYRTSQPNIFAAGDVIGFPSLASVSMDQGRVAVSHMFGINDLPELTPELPFGIYTIPEVSMIGKTESQAVADGLSVCTGRAHYRNMPRGKIMGLKDGFLKLVFLRETTQIIGVHIIGQLASELVHYGITLVHNKKTLHDVIEAVFNFPTLHDLYKYAAYDGLGNLSGHKVKEQ